jgi:hypothetical protein
MRPATAFLLTAALLILSGCMQADRGGASDADVRSQASQPAGSGGAMRAPTAAVAEQNEPAIQKVSLDEAGASQAAPVATERKIIRNANLTIEIAAPAESQRRIASIAESRGGFVVTSESRQQRGGDEKPFEIVTVEVRVPAAQFDTVLNEIRGVGGRITEEKVTGQDVTEEYIDLEARIRTKKALEEQFVEIMKRAQKVSDALEVQTAMADVRTEIERLEGRRRFLENQTSLSTLKITLQPPAPLISANTSGFFHGVKLAFGDGLDVAAAIVLGLIRLAIALTPIVLFILLPAALLVRFFVRRQRRLRLAEKLQQQSVPDLQ